MPSITKLEYSFASRYKIDEYIKEKNISIPEPILSILKLIADYKTTRKNTDNVKFIKQFTNENGNDSDGFYKYDLFIINLNDNQYQVKMDIDFSGSQTTNVVITSITFK